LALLGTLQLWGLVGLVPAALGLATWGLYVWIYTPLKVISASNTAVGTLPGALPVLIGWSAAGGSWTEPTGWLLFGLLVIWQFPHFMAIAWLFRDQYHAAGFQMLTRVDPSGRLAGWHAVIGAALLFPTSWGLTAVGPGAGIGAGSIAVSLLGLLVVSHQFVRSVAFFRFPNDLSARRLLRSSLLVLPAMLVLALVAQWMR
jgi:protoheme IX farnesyltransferase